MQVSTPGQGGVLGLELHSEMGRMGMARQPRTPASLEKSG